MLYKHTTLIKKLIQYNFQVKKKSMMKYADMFDTYIQLKCTYYYYYYFI